MIEITFKVEKEITSPTPPNKSDCHLQDDSHFSFTAYSITCGSPKMKLSITATSTSPAPSSGPRAPVP